MQEEGGNSPQSNRGETYEYSTPTIFFLGGTGTYGFETYEYSTPTFFFVFGMGQALMGFFFLHVFFFRAPRGSTQRR